MQYLGILKLEEFSLNEVIELVPDRYNHKCNHSAIKKVYEHHIYNDLRYNCVSGVTRDNSGELARFSNSKDIPKYSMLNTHEILDDQFMPYINNSLSRLKRGLTA